MWLSVPGSLFPVPVILPRHLVADRDLASRKYHRERSAAPVRVHRRAQAGNGFLHALARLGFAGDLESSDANAEYALSRVGECDATDHQVRAPSRRRRVGAGLAHQFLPDLALDD